MNPKPRRLFVNLPVNDLDRTMAFFSGLGFTFDSRFTDEKAAAMIVNDLTSVMLLQADYFATFTTKPLSDTARTAGSLVAISCASREEVDELADRALADGGSPAMDPQDHGFMYVRSFHDPDGHHWEVVWMDETEIESWSDGE